MSNSRRWRFVALVLAIVLMAALAWNWRVWQAKAQVGAGYGARMTCSCRYVEGRDMQSCKGDTEPGMEIVSLTDSPSDRSVTARVPLMANRTARYRAGFGCLLE
ncbi:hypothetical protein C1T17_17030 [Sphingobium sp. SCG-1]|uniref:hypothetical protein n=1 Tax=Sphingobium sp. SCG-1 TaxID=2072936 RepID=UPI000CD69A3D|nr:hypothetical protein [Sphingobium sp. SCG-1]AUW59526.1 hypothetical protein C1T17_17030 [Sphingobium sp. SCG-1]